MKTKLQFIAICFALPILIVIWVIAFTIWLIKEICNTMKNI